MPFQAGYAKVTDPINITGQLFNKTDVATPLFSTIQNNQIASRRFITGAEYDTGYPDPAAPVAGISESDSRTAPDPTFLDRENDNNVTQIFHESVEVTYRKSSNSADLTGYGLTDPQPSLVGNTNNVPSELAWQLAQKIRKMRMDIENVLLNGTFQDSNGVETVADQTRGLLEATVSNVIDANGEEIDFNLLYSVAEMINSANGHNYTLDSYVLVVDSQGYRQIQKIALNEQVRIDPYFGGAAVSSILTPFGVIDVMTHRYMPAGTAELVCLPVLKNMFQPVPEHPGMPFVYEPLAKIGASDRGQIYGQWGLNYGNEWMHLKIENVATTTEDFTAPQRFVTNIADVPTGA